MSTLRVNSITNNGSAVNFTTDIIVGNGRVVREYYSQGTEPAGASNGAVWWDTSSSAFKLRIDNKWYVTATVAPPPPMLGDRAVFAGGTNVIDYVSVPTAGNATSFGTLPASASGLGAASNGSRAVFGNTALSYVTISTPGNATSFGNLSVTRTDLAATSGVTRGLFAGGLVYPTEYNVIDYITIATTGNAIDFGDLTNTPFGLAACSSTTYSVFAGGTINADVGAAVNVIGYVTTSTLGNATSFGTLSVARYRPAGFSDGARGVFSGGGSNANYNAGLNVIDYITIATPSNATDFGDLITARNYTAGAANTVRGLTAGGYNTSMTELSSIEFITIATLGNATSFGNLTSARFNLSGCSGN